MSHIHASAAGGNAFALFAATVLCSAAAGQEHEGRLIKKSASAAEGGLEYNEFVFSDFNDPFAFYLNGVNIAKVPGSPGTAVTIDTVNCGNHPFSPPLGGVNCSLYVNHDLTDGGGPSTPRWTV